MNRDSEVEAWRGVSWGAPASLYFANAFGIILASLLNERTRGVRVTSSMRKEYRSAGCQTLFFSCLQKLRLLAFAVSYVVFAHGGPLVSRLAPWLCSNDKFMRHRVDIPGKFYRPHICECAHLTRSFRELHVKAIFSQDRDLTLACIEQILRDELHLRDLLHIPM